MNLSEDARPIPHGQPQIVREVGAWLSRLQSRLERFGAIWAARRQRSREIRELHRFSDRELWDVGLSRSDLLAISEGRYRRD